MNDWFDYILHHMRAQPEKPALVMENRVATYAMLKTGMERCALRIAGLNLARGEPVAVLYADPIRHLTLCLALQRIGIPSLSLAHGHAGIGTLKIGAVLGDAEAKGINFPNSRPVEVTEEWFAADAADHAALPRSLGKAGDICRLSLTSGSTGAPKLVALTAENIGRRLQYFVSANWNSLLCLPGLTTTFGFIPSCAALAGGRTLCFAQSPYQAVRMIELFGVDYAIAATEQLVALTRVARKTNARLASLRSAQVGGSVPTRAMLEAAAIYVCRGLINYYAMTELGVMAHADAQEILQKPGLAGHIAPGVEIGIFDDEGKRCADGTPGHVKARHEETAGEWIAVGDTGWIAPENQLYIVGRSADGAAGSGISPAYELEHLLRLEWDMSDAGAVLIEGGAKPEIWLGTVDAKDASAEKLEAIARARGVDCTLRLVALPAIPRTANGKINRAQLKAALLAATAGKA